MHVKPTKEGKRISSEIDTRAVNSPHDAMTGYSGCLAMDLILPEHFPKKHPSNFPVRQQCIDIKQHAIQKVRNDRVQNNENFNAYLYANLQKQDHQIHSLYRLYSHPNLLLQL